MTLRVRSATPLETSSGPLPVAMPGAHRPWNPKSFTWPCKEFNLSPKTRCSCTPKMSPFGSPA
eukprot:1595515-Pyramimonas_sp.AAC.1